MLTWRWTLLHIDIVARDNYSPRVDGPRYAAMPSAASSEANIQLLHAAASSEPSAVERVGKRRASRKRNAMAKTKIDCRDGPTTRIGTGARRGVLKGHPQGSPGPRADLPAGVRGRVSARMASGRGCGTRPSATPTGPENALVDPHARHRRLVLAKSTPQPVDSMFNSARARTASLAAPRRWPLSGAATGKAMPCRVSSWAQWPHTCRYATLRCRPPQRIRSSIPTRQG